MKLCLEPALFAAAVADAARALPARPPLPSSPASSWRPRPGN